MTLIQMQNVSCSPCFIHLPCPFAGCYKLNLQLVNRPCRLVSCTALPWLWRGLAIMRCLRRARLVLEWVTVCERVNHLSNYVASQLGQLSQPSLRGTGKSNIG